VLRAFQHAGKPRQADPLGSFEEWSDLVRSALMWLGKADPVTTLESARRLDPRLEELSAVLSQWGEVIKDEAVSVREVVQKAVTTTVNQYDFGKPTFVHTDLREALLAVAGQGGAINSRRLGKWLAANQKRIVEGSWIEQAGTLQGYALWKLVSR
jgi:putative DNA primase/helicase